MIGVIP